MTSTPSPAPEGEMKLRECPFCGGEPDDCPQNSERPHPSRKHEWCVYIWCDNCNARGPEKREPEDAIAAWNTRPTPIAEGDKELVNWLNAVRTGKHPDITLHSGMAAIRLQRAADRLEQLSGK